MYYSMHFKYNGVWGHTKWLFNVIKLTLRECCRVIEIVIEEQGRLNRREVNLSGADR